MVMVSSVLSPTQHGSTLHTARGRHTLLQELVGGNIIYFLWADSPCSISLPPPSPTPLSPPPTLCPQVWPVAWLHVRGHGVRLGLSLLVQLLLRGHRSSNSIHRHQYQQQKHTIRADRRSVRQTTRCVVCVEQCRCLTPPVQLFITCLHKS